MGDWGFNIERSFLRKFNKRIWKFENLKIRVFKEGYKSYRGYGDYSGYDGYGGYEF